MASDVPVELLEEMMFEEQEPICADNDWQCMLQNFYKGYILFAEAVVQTGIDEEGNPVTGAYGVDVSDLTNDEINAIIENLKVIYPNAIEYRLHYCGNHVGKPCMMIKV